MDEVTYIINGIDVEGVLDGGSSPVVVDGNFIGEITAEQVTLSEHGFFTGKLFATQVEISGRFNGELVCETLNVTATGKIDGSVKVDSLAIDLGAEVMGSISRAK
jgi:cytoskeletal protein CcmA (bactofilin family)